MAEEGIDKVELSLSNLPPELLTNIFSYLSNKDISQVSSTCKYIREVVGSNELFWQKKCQRDYGIKLHFCDTQSAMLFYQKVLKPFGGCLGLWQQTNLKHYGSLMQVVFDDEDQDNWKLLFIVWEPPTGGKFSAPLIRRDLLSIQLCEPSTSIENHQAEIKVLDEFVKTDNCQINWLSPNSDGLGPAFRIELKSCPDWTEEPEIWMAYVRKFIDPELPDDQPLDMTSDENNLRVEKFVRTFHARQDRVFNHVTVQHLPPEMKSKACPASLLEPGIFKGTYGPHGIEFINLNYGTDEADSLLLVGNKVTGDPNVPMNQYSFKANFSKPLVYSNIQDQINLQSLYSMDDLPVVELPDSLDVLQQPFRLPVEFRPRVAFEETHCIARFQAICQVAFDNFTNPADIFGHFVIFNNDMFGVMFLDLGSFSLYHRIQENLEAINLSDL